MIKTHYHNSAKDRTTLRSRPFAADRAAVGTTLAGIPNRSYSAPASKYTDIMRQALPSCWVGLLDWCVQPSAWPLCYMYLCVAL